MMKINRQAIIDSVDGNSNGNGNGNGKKQS